MSGDCPMPFPKNLPYDIERTLIERAAYHDQKLATKLVGLTKEIRTWVDPILYHRVKIEYPHQAEAFIRTLEFSSKGSEFFTRYVRILCFAFGVTLDQVAKILSTCGGVRSLASWMEVSSQNPNTENKSLPRELREFIMNESSQLRRLSIILQDFFGTSDPDFTLPIIQRLSHLDIFQGSEHFKSWSWIGFHDLKHLTHLSFDLNITSPLDTVASLVPKFPRNLKVCLVLMSTRDDTTLEFFFSGNGELEKYISGEVDRRVVIGTMEELEEEYRHDGLVIVHPYEDFVADWTYTSDEKDDIWEKATRVVTRRDAARAKATKETS